MKGSLWRKAASRSIRLLHQAKMAADYRSELDAAEAASAREMLRFFLEHLLPA
jgi:hypothetical protein